MRRVLLNPGTSHANCYGSEDLQVLLLVRCGHSPSSCEDVVYNDLRVAVI